MRERWTMTRIAIIVLALSLGVFAAPAAAQTAGQGAEARVVVQKRAPTRLRVRPLYPYRHYNTPYPPAYDVEYPGPNAKRACVDRLVVEHRPSGTVIVPRMRCRWVRG
jgi:hypothetical protein